MGVVRTHFGGTESNEMFVKALKQNLIELSVTAWDRGVSVSNSKLQSYLKLDEEDVTSIDQLFSFAQEVGISGINK